jgi:hypothetical protein
MSYEWDASRARRAKMIKAAFILILALAGLGLPIAALLTISHH